MEYGILQKVAGLPISAFHRGNIYIIPAQPMYDTNYPENKKEVNVLVFSFCCQTFVSLYSKISCFELSNLP